MDDSIILFTGISVFSLMLVGIILTVVEFRQIAKKSDKPESRDAVRFEDKD